MHAKPGICGKGKIFGSFLLFFTQPVTTFSFAEVKLRFGINNKIFQFLFCSALNLH